jgi:hypothetical protein
MIIGGGVAVLLSLLLGACALTRQATSLPLRWNEFYVQPWVYVKWPTVAMVLPPTRWDERFYPTYVLKKRGPDLIVSGRYMFFETYPAIRHDLRKLGFSEQDVGKMKCFWADPDGKLREMERLRGEDEKKPGERQRGLELLEKAKSRPGLKFAAD